MTQGTWYVNDTERETEHTFKIDRSRPLELSASNVHGRTFVRGTDREDVLVQSTKHGRSDAKAYERARLRIEADGNVLKVHPDYGTSNFTYEGFDLEDGIGVGRDIVRDVVRNMFGKQDETPPQSEPATAPDHSGRPRFDIVIEVPKSLADGSHVTIRTTSGPVGCADLTCRIDASSASSDWHLRAITGSLTVQTASGDVRIEGLDGSLTYRSASGDAQVTDAKLRRLNVNTASGDISVQGRLVGDEECRIHTVSGDVRLELAPPAPSEITFKGVSGDAFVHGPFEQVGRKAWRSSQGGGAQLAVKTVSGDLHLHTFDDGDADVPGKRTPEDEDLPKVPSPPASPPPPAPPAHAAPATSAASAIPLASPAGNGTHPTTTESAALDEASEAERLDLLQALERGEIDVEDAMRRLDELDAGDDSPPL